MLILADHFLTEYAAHYLRSGLTLSDDARRLLREHAWPGNVRELRNALERAVILSASDRIEADGISRWSDI